MSKLRKGSFALVAVALVATAVAATAFAGTARTSATTITVASGKPTEFKFTLSKLTAPKGAVTFKFTNKGAIQHDFKIAGKKTPAKAKGGTATLSATLKAGKYPFQCTLPGHAAAGMKGVFTVK